LAKLFVRGFNVSGVVIFVVFSDCTRFGCIDRGSSGGIARLENCIPTAGAGAATPAAATVVAADASGTTRDHRQCCL
jgi:hypothetical protein